MATEKQIKKAAVELDKEMFETSQLGKDFTDEQYRTFVIDAIPQLEDTDEWTPATQKVIDALKAEVEEAAAEAKVEKKKEKKGKGKKEEPAAEADLSPAEMVDVLKPMKKKTEILEMLENPVFNEGRKKLAKIDNHLSLKKAMREYLEADDAPVPEETKKEKKAREKTEAAAAPPVVETKKEKKAREKAEKKAAPKKDKNKKRISRITVMAQVFHKNLEGSMEDLVKEADKLYSEHEGKDLNFGEQKAEYRRVKQVFEAIGILN